MVRFKTFLLVLVSFGWLTHVRAQGDSLDIAAFFNKYDSELMLTDTSVTGNDVITGFSITAFEGDDPQLNYGIIRMNFEFTDTTEIQGVQVELALLTDGLVIVVKRQLYTLSDFVAASDLNGSLVEYTFEGIDLFQVHKVSLLVVSEDQAEQVVLKKLYIPGL
jgi:hypothetical protein